MKLSDRQKKIIDIIQWICIIFLLMVCITGSIFKKSDNGFIKDTEYQKEQAYVKIYETSLDINLCANLESICLNSSIEPTHICSLSIYDGKVKRDRLKFK